MPPVPHLKRPQRHVVRGSHHSSPNKMRRHTHSRPPKEADGLGCAIRRHWCPRREIRPRWCLLGPGEGCSYEVDGAAPSVMAVWQRCWVRGSRLEVTCSCVFDPARVSPGFCSPGVIILFALPYHRASRNTAKTNCKPSPPLICFSHQHLTTI